MVYIVPSVQGSYRHNGRYSNIHFKVEEALHTTAYSKDACVQNMHKQSWIHRTASQPSGERDKVTGHSLDHNTSWPQTVNHIHKRDTKTLHTCTRNRRTTGPDWTAQVPLPCRHSGSMVHNISMLNNLPTMEQKSVPKGCQTCRKTLGTHANSSFTKLI